jgi:hypothetical protein
MTIKTWQERLSEITDTSYQGYATNEEIEECKQAEIDELRAALDAWEKQEPVATSHKIYDAEWFSVGLDTEDYGGDVVVMPLYTKPKGAT